uniref:Uncharacterized protein n=1 Tax=Ursus americanus TaxID=9643 RepID=A0A452S549_URSAM
MREPRHLHRHRGRLPLPLPRRLRGQDLQPPREQLRLRPVPQRGHLPAAHPGEGTPLLSEGQAVCFTVLGVLTSLVVLGTVGIVFLHKCEAWLSHLRYHRVLRRKNSLLLHCNSGEDLAVNILFPEKLDMATFSKEAGEDDI